MTESDQYTHEPITKKKTLYEVLEIDKKATDDDIKKAYRKLALRYHPDKNLNGDITKTEKFKEINYANAVLSNPEKKKLYDDYGDFGLKMMDQLGEERMAHFRVFMKPWVKVLVMCGLFVLTAGCFGCFCCCCCGCQCCCNFCCGRYKPKEEQYMETDYNDIINDDRDAADPIMSQPQIIPELSPMLQSCLVHRQHPSGKLWVNCGV
uniref:J domain-containing protein n=1 Tax=Ditylenchus dipsaci TaxID=166011 RepID=A0A915DII5_9BILA